MKKAIIISDKNMDRISAAIAEAEGMATARTIDFKDIVRACETIEKMLDISKTCMEGLVYDVDDCAQKFPHAYKYKPVSTQYTLTYQGGKWRVSDIRRDATKTEGHRFECVSIPEASKNAILKSRLVF